MTTKNSLTLGSLFDGSGGFPLGGLLCGITPVWASEIEPFPIRVTTKRLPFMKHYGDVSTMDGGTIEPVDIITFGSPCQDMSIAGKRAGLDGSRSNLFYQAVRIIREMRCATNGKYPRWVCWENVPGAFSSNGGADFKAVLDSLIGVVEPTAEVPAPETGRWPHADIYMGDGWSLAYRTLDAQHWGVPQRRKRIFLVADFAGECAGRVLFESEGVSGYSAESFRAWQGATRGASTRSGATGFDGYNGTLSDDVSATLGVNCGMSTGRCGVVLNDQGGQRIDVTDGVTCTLRAESRHPPCVIEDTLALENYPIDGRIKVQEGTVQTLTSRMGTGGNNVPLLLKIRSGCEGGGKGPLIQEDKSATLSCNNDQTLFQPCVFGIGSYCSKAMLSDNPHAGIYEADTARTLDTAGGNPSCHQGGIAVVETYALQGSMIGRKNENGPQGAGISKEKCFTLDTADRHAVVYEQTTFSKVSATLSADDGPKGPSSQQLGNPEENFVAYAKTAEGRLQTEECVAPTPLPVLSADNDPIYGIGRDAMNQGKNAKFSPCFCEGIQPTLVAKGPGGVVKGGPVYTVRRLTPTECARLQGFPDWWCSDLATPEPSYGDLVFWGEVFETHRRVMGSSSKPKTEKQIMKWLKSPHSDAAEYKMWGNGVALPCVYYVLSGIVWSTQCG